MRGVQKCSPSFVIDTNFHILSSISLLVMFINFSAYGSHKLFSKTSKVPLHICNRKTLSSTKNYVNLAISEDPDDGTKIFLIFV